MGLSRVCYLHAVYRLLAGTIRWHLYTNLFSFNRNSTLVYENIIRNKLTALEMAEQLMRRKEIYEIKYPEMTQSAKASISMKQNQIHSLGNTFNVLPKMSFVENTAFNIGKSKNTIFNYVKIASDIPKDKEL